MHKCAYTQAHCLFPYTHNSMGRFSDKIGEKSGAGPTTLHALRDVGVMTPTSKRQAIIKHFYNQKYSITLFSLIRD